MSADAQAAVDLDDNEMRFVPSEKKAPALAPPERRRRYPLSHHVLFLVMCTGVIVGSFLLNVSFGSRLAMPWMEFPLPSVCQFRNLTGLDCPGCGLSRAFVSIAHGDLAAAWKYNAASLLVFALLLVQLPSRAVQIYRIRSGLPAFRWPRTINVTLWIVVAALFLQWVVKTVSHFAS